MRNHSRLLAGLVILVLLVKTSTELVNTCGEHGIGAGDILHPTAFGGYCLCPVGSQCNGDGCQELTDSRHTHKFFGFAIEQCAECTCSELTWSPGHKRRMIIFRDGAEGMGSWRFSISEAIFLARLTSRSLVLPCVAAGRLVPCDLDGALDIGEYVEFPKLLQYYEHLVSFKEMLKINQSTHLLDPDDVTVLCCHPKCMTGREPMLATNSNLRIANGYNLLQKDVPIIRLYNNLLFRATDAILEKPVTILTHYFKGTFMLGSLRGKKVKPDDFGVLRCFSFANTLYVKAKAIERSLGLKKKYIAVHWRSETAHCHFSNCAAELAAGIQRVIKAKYRQWDSMRNESACLLVSDIPYDPTRVLWGPFKEDLERQPNPDSQIEGMAHALQLLGVTKSLSWGGCRKTDSVPELRSMDTGLLSIMDKILATNADMYFTCRQSPGRSVCGKCTRPQSNFGYEILQLRQKAILGPTKRSYRSWPASRNATLSRATGATESVEQGQESQDSGNGDQETLEDNNEEDEDQSSDKTPIFETCKKVVLNRDEVQLVPKAARTKFTKNSPPQAMQTMHLPRPPILWTFPGSGNTWCRMLLEQGTGWMTGSVYQDSALKRIFRGEGLFGRRDLVAIKAHPNVKFGAKRIMGYFGKSPPLILVVRDPFKAIWAEAQRRLVKVSRKWHPSHGGTHVMTLQTTWLQKEENWKLWTDLALRLAEEYVQMWTDYKTLINAGSKKVFVPFEALTDPSKQHTALQRMLAFIGDNFNNSRVKCAFLSSNLSTIRRSRSTEKAANFSVAFPPSNPLWTCKVWDIIKNCIPVAKRLGYPWTYTPPFLCP
eukprot:m.214511 g.214511  ORF g.214511 m.214511 type:complete len:826 (-) comp15869_c1_seq1:1829-4306(-)